jgi:DNA-binding NarL/FixJ family response regulator
MPKVLIADDHPLFRDALRDVVSRLFELRGWNLECLEAATRPEVITIVQDQDDIDLILLDIFMPGGSGLCDLVALRETAPAVPVMIVSMLDDPAIIRRAIVCGAAGYIPKSSSRELMAAALQTVLAGGIYLPRELIADMRLHTASLREPTAETGALTPRQITVLSLLANGKSNKAIARELGISEATVKFHVTAVIRKLGVSTRAEAIAAFRQDRPHIDTTRHGRP